MTKRGEISGGRRGRRQLLGGSLRVNELDERSFRRKWHRLRAVNVSVGQENSPLYVFVFSIIIPERNPSPVKPISSTFSIRLEIRIFTCYVLRERL